MRTISAIKAAFCASVLLSLYSNNPTHPLESAIIYDYGDFLPENHIGSGPEKQDQRKKWMKENKISLNFSLENLQEGTHQCGLSKCLFPLKNDKRLGFLVGNPQKYQVRYGLSVRMQKAYNMSLEVIEKKYGMEHIYISAPHEKEIDGTFREWLGKNQRYGYNGQSELATFPQNNIVFQAVEIYPSNETIFWGCKKERLVDGLHQLVSLYTPENIEELNPKILALKVSSQFSKLYHLLEDHPCLFKDFQIFLTCRGQLVHLDVDRCFHKKSALVGEYLKKPEFLPIIEYFESKVLDQIERLSQHLNITTPNLPFESVRIDDYGHLFPDNQPENTTENHLSFSLQNLQGGSHPCGTHKCLFPLNKFKHLGYLAANYLTSGLSVRMKKAYNMSLEVVEKKYDMKHIYLAEPYQMEIDNNFREWLGENLSNESNGQSVKSKFPGNKVIVQAVVVIPSNESIFWGCERKRLEDGLHQLVSFYTPDNIRGINLSDMAAKVSSQFSKLFHLLEDYPCLFSDFQMFLTQTGWLAHLDLDRCFHTKDAQVGKFLENTECVQVIKYFETKILGQIEQLSHYFNSSTPTHSFENVSIDDYWHLFPDKHPKNEMKKQNEKNIKLRRPFSDIGTKNYF